MKILKYLFMIFVLVIISSLVYSQQNIPSVKITEVYNQVESKKMDNDAWEKAVIEEILKQNDSIRTGFNSYSEVELSSDNRFRIKENSQIVIKDLQKDTEDVAGSVVKLTQFDLLQGDIVLKLDKLPKDTLVQVTSPTAIAGARGTTFGVSYVPEETISTVSVLESDVRVTSAGEDDKYVIVAANQKVTVAPWAKAVASVRGMGILSEKILGKSVIEKAVNPIAWAIGYGDNENDAKSNAYYNLAKFIQSIYLTQERQIEDLLNENPSLCESLYSYIAKAEIKSKKVIDDGRTEIVLELPVSPIADIIKYPLPAMPAVIKTISLKEYGDAFGPIARTTTQRAAQLDGYRKLAEEMYDTVISSKTTLNDMIAANDRITTTIEGVVKGAEIIETRYYSDGSISVTMSIRADIVRIALTGITGDVFGVNYFTSPRPIDINDFMEGEWK